MAGVASGISATAIAAWASLAVSVASAAYSIQQAKKQKDAAKRAAEARRGYEIPVEGMATNLAIVYGRSKIGGARVYHNSTGGFVFTDPGTTVDKTFLSGLTPASDSTEYVVTVDTRGGGWTVYINAHDTRLTKSFDGKKNEFLYFQQALCQGPIYKTHDVIIDEAKYLDDPQLGTDIYKSAYNKIEAALRIDMHNGKAVGQEDLIFAANFGERRRAKFYDIANASVTIRLDRKNPQFSGTPTIQFLVEGKLIRKITRTGVSPNYVYALNSTGGIYNNGYEYSNNPVFVLLDYLLDPISGKGLDITEINLESFYNAAITAATVVQSGVAVGGKIYKPTDGGGGVSGTNSLTRDLPLYECNTTLDTKRPIRENIETILSTMGDARLIWSQGKYKVSLVYPTSEAQTAALSVLTLDDSNLVLDQEVNITFPSASDRYNFATVKFANESEDFKDDTASWPPKLEPTINKTETYFVGIGGKRYPPGISANGWEDQKGNGGGRLLNNYAVWNGNDNVTSLEYRFILEAENQGPLVIEYASDDTCSWSLYVTTIANPTGTLIASGSSGTKILKQTNNQLQSLTDLGEALDGTQDRLFRLVVTATDLGDETDGDQGSATKGRGFAFRLLKGNFIVWSTREISYDAFREKTVSNTLYRTYLAEDNGMELETEIYAEGITDYYHALAKAEELVRTSRGAFGLNLTFRITIGIPEPGDIVRVNSTTLELGTGTALYCRVEGVKLVGDFLCEVVLKRFDHTFLAWNVKDDAYIQPPNIYDYSVPAPRYVTYSTDPTVSSLTSAGRLDWPLISLSDFECFIIYAFTDKDIAYFDPETNVPLFIEIGRTTENFFILPAINAYSAIFGVRTLTKSGKLSNIVFVNAFNSGPTQVTVQSVILNNYNTGATNLTPSNSFTGTIRTTMGGWRHDEGLLANSIITSQVDPYGTTAPLLRISGDGTTASTENNWFGRWVHPFDVDPKKSYISYVWIKRRSSTSNNIYLGWEPLNNIENLSGVLVANPYFVNGQGAILTTGKWYLAVGVIHYDGFSGADTGLAGIYDPLTGLRVYDGAEFQHVASSAKQGLLLGYYNTAIEATTDGFDFLPGGTYVMDGTHPTKDNITNLMGPLVSGYLTNEAHTVPAYADGTGAVLTGSDGNFKVFYGLSDVTEFSTFSIVDGIDGGASWTKTQNGLVMTIIESGASDGSYSLSGTWTAATDVETFTLRATYNTVVLDKVFSISKSKAGAPGDDNTAYWLDISSPVIFKDSISRTADGVHTSILVTGKRTVGDVTTNHGYVTITGDYETESTTASNAYPITKTPGSADDESVYTVKLYNQATVAGATLLDTQTVPVVFKGATGTSGTDSTVYWLHTTAPVIFKDSPDVTTDGIHTNITVTGKRTIGATTTDYGYLTVTANGDTEAGTATATTITTAIANGADKLNYTVKLYNDAVKTTLLDTQVIPVVFKGATGSSGTAAAYVVVNGEQAFKFLAGQSVPTVSSITLTATLFGSLSVYDWEYWNGTAWANLGGTQNTSTYILAYDNAAWSTNTSLRIRCRSGADTYTDEITIVKLYDGSSGTSGTDGENAITIILSNESHTIPTDSAGNNGIYTGSGLDIRVYEGTTPVPYDDTVTYASPSFRITPTPSNITLGTASTVSTYTRRWSDHSAMLADTANVSFAITVKNSDGVETTFTRVQSLTKAKQGATGTSGANAITLRVIPDKETFTYNGSGTATPSGQYITITTSKQNTTNAVTWSTTPATSLRATSTAGSTIVTTGNTVYLHEADFAGQSSVTITGTITADSVSDKFTVVKLQDGTSGTSGASAFTVSVSNEAHTFAASILGVITDYANSGTTIKAWYGTTALTYGLSGANTFSVSASASNITAGTASGTGTVRTYANHSNMTANQATITYTIICRDANAVEYTFTKLQTFSKSLAGTPGMSAVLSNENHTFTASSTGVVSTYVGSGTNFYVYDGDQLLTYVTSGPVVSQYTIAIAVSNITAGTLSGTGTTTATIGDHNTFINAQNTASITYTITGYNRQNLPFTIVKTQTFSKSKTGTAGADGTNASFRWIYTSAPVVFKDSPDRVTNGAHTTVSIKGKETVAGVTSDWGYITVTGIGYDETEAVTATASSIGITLAPALGADESLYEVKLYDGATVATATLIDTQTIPVVFKGASGASGTSPFTAVLSNEAHVFPASVTGVVSSYAGSGTNLYVYEGITALTYVTTSPTAGQWTFTTTPANITVGTISGTGTTTATVGVHSGVASGTDASSIVYNISGYSANNTAFNLTKTQSFSKSKTGATGNTGADGDSAITIVLTNEAHTCPTTAGGTVNYTGSGTDIFVYEGSTQLDYNAAGTSPSTWNVTAADGTVGTIAPGTKSSVGTTPNRYARYGDHSGMSTSVADIVYTISGQRADGTAFSFTKQQTFAKSLDGAAGTNAKLLYVSADKQTVSYNSSDTVVAGQTINFTVTTQNTTGVKTVYLYEMDGTTELDAGVYLTGSGTIVDNSPGANQFTMTGTTITMTGANFNTAITTGATTGVVVKVLQDGVSDLISVVKIKDGADGTDGTDGTNGTDGVSPTFYYIKPLNGTAIKNNTGSLTIEAHSLAENADVLLSSGNIKLYDETDGIEGDGYTATYNAADFSSSTSRVIRLADMSATVAGSQTVIVSTHSQSTYSGGASTQADVYSFANYEKASTADYSIANVTFPNVPNALLVAEFTTEVAAGDPIWTVAFGGVNGVALGGTSAAPVWSASNAGTDVHVCHWIWTEAMLTGGGLSKGQTNITFATSGYGGSANGQLTLFWLTNAAQTTSPTYTATDTGTGLTDLSTFDSTINASTADSLVLTTIVSPIDNQTYSWSLGTELFEYAGPTYVFTSSTVKHLIGSNTGSKTYTATFGTVTNNDRLVARSIMFAPAAGSTDPNFNLGSIPWATGISDTNVLVLAKVLIEDTTMVEDFTIKYANVNGTKIGSTQSNANGHHIITYGWNQTMLSGKTKGNNYYLTSTGIANEVQSATVYILKNATQTLANVLLYADIDSANTTASSASVAISSDYGLLLADQLYDATAVGTTGWTNLTQTIAPSTVSDESVVRFCKASAKLEIGTYSGTRSYGMSVKPSSDGVLSLTLVPTQPTVTTIVYDSITLSNILDGEAASGTIAAELSISNASLWAYADGSIYDYTPANGTFQVYVDTVLTGTGNIFTIYQGTDNGASWSKTQNGLTLTINETSGVYSISGTSWTTDQESFTMIMTRSTTVIQKTFVVTKNKGGYEILSSLPSSNLFQGRTVYLTVRDTRSLPVSEADKLYKWTSTATTWDGTATNCKWYPVSPVVTGTTISEDPGFEAPVDTWKASVGTPIFTTVTDGVVGAKVFRSGTSETSILSRRLFPINVNTVYRVKSYIRRSATANGTAYIGLALLDSNFANISGNGSYWYLGAIGATPGTSWANYYGTVGPSGSGADLLFSSYTNGTNAKWMQVVAIGNLGGSSGYHEFQDLRLEEAIDGTIIRAGSIQTNHMTAGTIHGDRISGGTIVGAQLQATTLSAIKSTLGTVEITTGGHLRSGQTAFNTGTGFFLGSDGGTPKFSIGNSSANHLFWDGTQLKIYINPSNIIADASLTADDYYSFATRVNTATATVAAIQYWSNGEVYRNVNGTVTLIGNWYTPTTTSIGSSYYIKFLVISATGMQESQNAVVMPSGINAISTTRIVSLSTPATTNVVDYNATVVAYIYSDSGGTNLLAQKFISLTAIKDA